MLRGSTGERPCMLLDPNRSVHAVSIRAVVQRCDDANAEAVPGQLASCDAWAGSAAAARRLVAAILDVQRQGYLVRAQEPWVPCVISLHGRLWHPDVESTAYPPATNLFSYLYRWVLHVL